MIIDRFNTSKKMQRSLTSLQIIMKLIKHGKQKVRILVDIVMSTLSKHIRLAMSEICWFDFLVWFWFLDLRKCFSEVIFRNEWVKINKLMKS